MTGTMNEDVVKNLDRFRDENKITNSKGKLSLVVQLTRQFTQSDFPLHEEDYVTEKGGQVKGLGGSALASILNQHGVKRTLSREGGRTSRGNMDLMKKYVHFVNNLFEKYPYVTLPSIEDYWVQQVRAFFATKPFTLSSDSSWSISACVDDLLSQAYRRQEENPGTMYQGTVLQTLVAAKLETVVPDVEINGTSVADDPTGRVGDFMVGDVALHCTTAPGTPLIEKCVGNIREGLNPVIVTIRKRVEAARSLAQDANIGDSVEVWDVQQFLSSNVQEHGSFNPNGRKTAIDKIVEKYNEIVDEFEDDPSLHIKFESA